MSVVQIGSILPELMSTYGDSGNAVILQQRLELRNIKAKIVIINLKDPVPSSLDLYTIGGAEDNAQELAVKHLIRYPGLQKAASYGTPILAICAGIQILGQWYESKAYGRIKSIGLLDVITFSQKSRIVGEAISIPLIKGLTQPLTGFENHLNGTSLGAEAKPLSFVIKGRGNKSRGFHDGAIQGNIMATYLHGPCLARNPELADYLLTKIVGKLPPLELPGLNNLRMERLVDPSLK